MTLGRSTTTVQNFSKSSFMMIEQYRICKTNGLIVCIEPISTIGKSSTKDMSGMDLTVLKHLKPLEILILMALRTSKKKYPTEPAPLPR